MKKILFIITMLVTSLGINAQEMNAKYQGEFDLSYSIGTGTFSTNRVNLHTIHGAKIGNYFSLGVGVGLDYYHEMYEKGELIVPIFANVKGFLPVNDKFSPYLSLDLGYVSNEMKQLLDIEINDIAKMIRSLKMHRTSMPIANRQLPISEAVL